MSFIASSQGFRDTTPAIDTSGADLIVLEVSGNDYTLTPTDTYMNTWTQAVQDTGPGFAMGNTQWYCHNPSVGSGHVFSVGSGTATGIMALAMSGSVASPLDQSNNANALSSGPADAGSVTPTTNGQLIVLGSSEVDQTSAWAASSGYTLFGTLPAQPAMTYGGAASYQIQTTATATDPNISYASSAPQGFSATVATFKGTFGGGGTAYTLTADAGAYAVTGTAATFTAQHRMMVDAGSYLITGTAATLTASIHTHYTLSVLAGSYLITGTRATLRWSGAPPVTGNFPQCLNIAVMGL